MHSSRRSCRVRARLQWVPTLAMPGVFLTGGGVGFSPTLPQKKTDVAGWAPTANMYDLCTNAWGGTSLCARVVQRNAVVIKIQAP